MDWGILLRESLWMSAAFSAMMTVLIMGSILWNREMWLNDYPPDVKAKWGTISEKARKERNIFAVIFFGTMIAALIYVPIRLTDALGTTPGFLTILVCVAIIYSIFNLVDAFIIDWLFLTKLFPQIIILPGTEGMAGYTDMKWWAVNLFKGIPISLMMGLISAGATSLVMWVGTLI
jgi:hypothetical protein